MKLEILLWQVTEINFSNKNAKKKWKMKWKSGDFKKKKKREIHITITNLFKICNFVKWVDTINYL